MFVPAEFQVNMSAGLPQAVSKNKDAFFYRDRVEVPEEPIPWVYLGMGAGPISIPPGIGDWRRAAVRTNYKGFKVFEIPAGTRFYRGWKGPPPTYRDIAIGNVGLFLGSPGVGLHYGITRDTNIWEFYLYKSVRLIDFGDLGTVRRFAENIKRAMETEQLKPMQSFVYVRNVDGRADETEIEGMTQMDVRKAFEYVFSTIQGDTRLIRSSIIEMDRGALRVINYLLGQEGFHGYGVDAIEGFHEEIALSVAIMARPSTNWMSINRDTKMVTYHHKKKPVKTFHMDEIYPAYLNVVGKRRGKVRRATESGRLTLDERLPRGVRFLPLTPEEQEEVYAWYQERGIPIRLARIGEELPDE